MRNHPSNRGIRAYSLIELLVAMSISLMLLALILGMLSTTLDTWRSTGAYRQQHKAARILFETIESDLLATVIRPSLPSDKMESVPWLKVESAPFLGNVASRLSLVAPILDQSPSWKGDVCLIQYELAERETSEGRNVMLFREVRDPEALYSRVDWGAEFSADDEQALRPASVVTSNFSQFQIALEVRGDDGSTKIVTADLAPVVSHDGDVSWTGSSAPHRLLAVHVTAEILSPAGLNILFDNGYDAIPEKFKRSFFHRVPLADGRY